MPGAIIILWLLTELTKLVWLVMKTLFRFRTPCGNNDDMDNSHTGRKRPRGTHNNNHAFQKHAKLFEFVGKQTWGHKARSVLLSIPYALVRLVFMFRRDEENNKVCLEFLYQAGKDAEKAFKSDTQPMGWVDHELRKLLARNQAEIPEYNDSNHLKIPLLRAGG